MHRPRPVLRASRLNSKAALETTRELSPEEMAELQLELGYVDHALAIYERLLRADPKNALYRRRCEWLARLSWAKVRAVPSAFQKSSRSAEDRPAHRRPSENRPEARPDRLASSGELKRRSRRVTRQGMPAPRQPAISSIRPCRTVVVDD